MSHHQPTTIWWHALAWQGDEYRVVTFLGRDDEMRDWLSRLIEAREPVVLSLLMVDPLETLAARVVEISRVLSLLMVDPLSREVVDAAHRRSA